MKQQSVFIAFLIRNLGIRATERESMACAHSAAANLIKLKANHLMDATKKASC